jgi:hypothetical protein
LAQQEESWFNATGDKAALAAIQNDLAAIHNGVATSNVGQSLKTNAFAMIDSYNNSPPPIDPSDYSGATASWADAGQDIITENNFTDAPAATAADVATLLSQATTYINNWNAAVSAAGTG